MHACVRGLTCQHCTVRAQVGTAKKVFSQGQILPELVDTLDGVVAVATGSFHSMFLQVGGWVHAYGRACVRTCNHDYANITTATDDDSSQPASQPASQCGSMRREVATEPTGQDIVCVFRASLFACPFVRALV